MSPIETAVASLNEAFKADPDAMHALMENHVPCNAALAAHPTIQVRDLTPFKGHEAYTVGAIGLLNGVLEPLTGQRVAAIWSDEEYASSKLLGFRVYVP